MDFALSDEQQMLLDTSRRFIASEYTFEQRAKLLECDLGWSRDVWRQMAELGLLAVDIPEDDGGIGAGAIGVMLVSQAVGEGLMLEPFLSSAVLATRAIVTLGSVEQRARWLPALADGSLIAVLAHDETHSGIAVTSISCRAVRSGDGWTLSGRKAAIHHAQSADLLLVSARCDDGAIGLFALPRDAAGVSLSGFHSVDGQRAAHIDLVDVAVGADARLGDDAGVALQAVVDYGLAAYCAEAFGSLERILKATIDYSRARSQFGAPIGSFQALQHRMADLLIAAEQARSMVYLATARSEDADPARRRAALSGAKVLIGQAARLIGQQAVQLHGGMGMTDELDVSHCFKRLLAFELRFGSTDQHLAAYREGIGA